MVLPECNECHREADVTPNHIGGWNTEHSRLASKEGNNCSACHDQGFCADCHFGGGIVPRSHRSDFREIHPIAAKDAPRSCEKCHAPRFCSDCHAKFQPEELQFQSHRKGWLNQSPHTNITGDCYKCHPNSVMMPHDWKREHAREAKRDLPSCQACHEDGETCIKCHSSRTGLKVNPHPDNWGSIQGNLNRAAGKRTCVRCH
jgi:hypothetical protein